MARRSTPVPAATRTRRAAAAALVAVGAVLLAGCGSALPQLSPSGTPRPTPSRSSVGSVAPLPWDHSSASVTAGRPPTTTVVLPPDPGPQRQLPRGGTRILGHYRVVAYYGAPGGDTLGVLGDGTPAQAAAAVERQAHRYDGFGLPVQPAMELIATVAQGSPGADGDYSAPVPLAEIRRYLAAAHADRMLLILDLQPGRASFLSQARALRPLLLDPSVGLALDSEWKVRSDQTPGGGLIGSSPAAPINAVERFLSHLTRTNDLPDKLLVVHEFTQSMLPNRQDIGTEPGVETVFHADGFGTPALKTGVYRGLHFPGRPYGAGFKLFFQQDSRLMSPAAVMRLRPRPDVISYE